jgi:hypothetical protein
MESSNPIYKGMVVSDNLQHNLIPSWLINEDFKKALGIHARVISFQDVIGFCSQTDAESAIKHYQEQRIGRLKNDSFTFHHEEKDSRYL